MKEFDCSALVIIYLLTIVKIGIGIYFLCMFIGNLNFWYILLAILFFIKWKIKYRKGDMFVKLVL